MKLLYILKSFASKAGTERVVSDKINYLAEAGYDITLVTYEQGNHSLAFALHSSVRVIDLNTKFFELSRQPLYKKPFLLFLLRRKFRARLQIVVDEILPDVIISTTYSFNLLDIILTLKTSARQIVESHVACFSVMNSYGCRNSSIMNKIAQLYDAYKCFWLKRCEMMVVLTEGDAIEWRRHVSHVEVVSNTVTVFPGQMSHDGKGKRIICVGRLHEQKGFDLLLDAFSQISEQCPGWVVEIFGSGSDEWSLKEKIRCYRLENVVHINAPTASIFDEYQRSEFLVLSSRYEGFGLVLIEAMSCGIPCVSFRCKYGPEEIITHRKDGLLVNNGDVHDLANQILWMINHTEERLQMGREARKSAMAYDKSNIMRQWEQLLVTH